MDFMVIMGFIGFNGSRNGLCMDFIGGFNGKANGSSWYFNGNENFCDFFLLLFSRVKWVKFTLAKV